LKADFESNKNMILNLSMEDSFRYFFVGFLGVRLPQALEASALLLQPLASARKEPTARYLHAQRLPAFLIALLIVRACRSVLVQQSE